MPDLKQLETALRNAHNAGDTLAAQRLAKAIQTERSKPDIGMAEGITRAGAQGLTFGFGDEIAAGAQAGWDWLANDKGFSDSYDQHLVDERAKLEQFREENPGVALASELVGGLVVPGGAVKTAVKGGTALARTAKGAATAGAMGGLYGFGAGEGGVEERAKNAGQTALISGGIGLAAPAVVSRSKTLIEHLLRNRATQKMVKEAPSAQALRQQASNIFKQADEATGLDRSVLTNSAGDIAAKMERKGLDEALTPQSHRALNRLLEEATLPKQNIGFRDLDILRRQAQIPASNMGNKTESAIGAALVDNIDDVIAKSSSELGSDVAEARKLWGQLRRSELMEEAFDKASRQASGFENGLRTQFRSILNNPRKRKGFSPDEIASMENVVNGSVGGNILKKVGKLGVGLNQQSNALMATLGSAGGATIGGPIGAFAVPAIGTAAQKLGERSTRKQAEFAKALTASGGQIPTPRLTAMQQLMLENMIRQSSGGVEAVR